MILIADSGSTKCQWAIIDENEIILKETEGLNPFFVDEDKISIIVKILSIYSVKKIFFYGAGCSSEEKKEIIRNGLRKIFTYSEIYVESDLLGAARAVYANNCGWIGIIGTGSNVAYYDGNMLIKYRPSLGFILGDEGSGAHIGKTFLKKIFYNQINKHIIQKFNENYGIEMYSILSELYKNPYPNRFLAQFTKFINQYKKEEDVQNIIISCFDELFKNHITPYYQQNQPVSFVGAIAFYFQNELNIVSNNNNIRINKILKTPIEGLVEYHKQKAYFY